MPKTPKSILSMTGQESKYGGRWAYKNKIITTLTQPQNNLNLAQLSWVWHYYDFAHHDNDNNIYSNLHIIRLWTDRN